MNIPPTSWRDFFYLGQFEMIIAIDGHSACGKSTLAKDLSILLGFVYIDSGAMYRAATLFFRNLSIPPTDLVAIEQRLPDLSIKMEPGNGLQVLLNGTVVTESIRATEINDWVSEYSIIPAIRKKMVDLQRMLACEQSVVMDGRDIGSVVFPKAEIKFFLTADIHTRTNRRLAELLAKGISAEFDNVQTNLLKRDHIDSTRQDSPLIQCPDAIVIDNSQMTRRQQADLALHYIQDKIASTTSR